MSVPRGLKTGQAKSYKHFKLPNQSNENSETRKTMLPQNKRIETDAYLSPEKPPVDEMAKLTQETKNGDVYASGKKADVHKGLRTEKRNSTRKRSSIKLMPK